MPVTLAAVIPASPEGTRHPRFMARAIASVEAQTTAVHSMIVMRGMRCTSARNSGVRRAAGADWVGFLDDDDYWMPGAVTSVLAACGGADVITVNSNEHGAAELPQARRDHLLRHGVVFASCSGLFVRREAFIALGGFDETLDTGDVFDFLLAARVAGLVCDHIPIPLYFKERASGNLTNTKARSDLLAERARILLRRGVVPHADQG